jgi:hypothetical protein
MEEVVDVVPDVEQVTVTSFPRFHVSNFNRVININMNKDMALLMFDLIRESNNNGGVDKSLFALSEKIEKQFFFMGDIS